MTFPEGLPATPISDDFFRKLSPSETVEFRKWARDNWKAGCAIESIWHPVIQAECAKMLEEYIREHTYKYDSGTLDWNFSFRQGVVAIDSSTESLSEEEQFEMAVEHFWEGEWDELSNGNEWEEVIDHGPG